MDYGAIVSDSIAFTRQALAGKWTTWLIFILCSLPFALINFVVDPKDIVFGGTIHWELVPWTQVIALFIAGLVLSFVLFGYLVRVYRGVTPPPAFDPWGSLFVDGIKLAIVGILWFVPAFLIIAGGILCFILGFHTTGDSLDPMLSAGFLLLLIGGIVFLISCIYSVVGCVRFARTASMREGFRFSAITETIQVIGWGAYLIALVIFFVLILLFSLVVALLALIPLVGWVIRLILYPVVQVFSARYVSRVYDHGVPPVPAPAPVQ